MKTIGIISDIHGYLSDEAHQALRGCDYILCAGDCETEQTLIELECIAPTIAVLGNCDRPSISPGIRSFATPTIEGLRFKMMHRPEDLGTLPGEFDVVVYGHTHVPRYETVRGVTYINPGSPTRPRNGTAAGLGRLVIDKGAIISYERIELY